MTIVYRINKPFPNSADQARAEWVARLMPGAEPSAAELGVSPEAIIAQAALETGWGKASIGNNIFGVQAIGGWAGATQQRSSFECDTSGCHPVVETFRDYATMDEGFRDHLKILHQQNFVAAGVWSKQGDVPFFVALKRGGYATAPNYVDALTGTLQGVKSYTANMTRVDVGPLPDTHTVTPTGNVVIKDVNDSPIVKNGNQGAIVGAAATTVATAAPAAAAVAGMDWKALLAVSAIILAGALAFAIYKLVQSKNTRIDMSRQGIA